MNYTNIKQSKKLLELGLSPESADMYWDYDENTQNLSEAMAVPIYEGSWKLHHKNWSKDIPCWSVGALMGVIPQYHIHAPYPNEDNYICWSTHSDLIDMECAGKSLIEAVYNYIIYLLENNYIKRGE